MTNMPVLPKNDRNSDVPPGKNVVLNKINQNLIDGAIFVGAFFIAFFVRFEGLPDPINLRQLLFFFPFVALARVVSFHLFSIYSIAWRYVSILDAISIFKACLPVSALLVLGRGLMPPRLEVFRVPYTVIALEFMLVLLGTLSVRMARRLLHERSERAYFGNRGGVVPRKNVLLIGAGNAGNMVLRELRQRTDLGLDVVGFIDDDPHKHQIGIQGVRVLGGTAQIPEIARSLHVDEAIITIANAASKDIRKIVEVCEGTRIKVKIVPGLFEILDDKIKVTKIREIEISDLLGRSVVSFESYRPDMIHQYQNQTILVTGAGGSIGSELCRQLAAFFPKELILLDKDENSIYEINYELRQKSQINISPVIADVRHLSRLTSIFERYRPAIIFHAAAHKHVPLMEFNIAEAILNNVAGTRNVAQLADRFQAKSLIFISTDKAVNPSSVMGATKKIGEIIIQEIAPLSSTRFSCVRFGNVLGSRGSVVPLFQKQIAQGGPLTITHPDVTRYFMSIAEAVQLIIQAGTIGTIGEIFVLDMGEPIKIVDLAKTLIKLSGYSEEDFEIKVIGLRPGEKLFEEILIDAERAASTKFKKIFVARPIQVDKSAFSRNMAALLQSAEAGDEAGIVDGLKEIGIGYLDSGSTGG
jgi:FlaA1/EpsC-like NDP-sugar epimerase